MIAFVLALFIGGGDKPATEPVVRTIRIHAHWSGLGTPIDESFTISGSDSSYLLGRRRIDRPAVERLAHAVAAAAVPEHAGIGDLASPEWLESHASAAYLTLTTAQGECSPAARKLFVATFNDSSKAAAALLMHYQSRHTDDVPSIDAEIDFSDGRAIHATSRSQHALMLPFHTDNGVTWNAGIPRALAALMPPDSKLRARLLDDDLASTLAGEIQDVIRKQWEELEERCLYSQIVTELEARFTIERTYHAWPGQFAAHLRRSDLPENLLIDVHISADANQKRNVEMFLRKVETYINRARQFVLGNRDKVFELEYFDGISLREDSVQLHGISRPDDPNIRRVRMALADCVLLRDHDDPGAHRHWVVLPSGEGLEWEE